MGSYPAFFLFLFFFFVVEGLVWPHCWEPPCFWGSQHAGTAGIPLLLLDGAVSGQLLGKLDVHVVLSLDFCCRLRTVVGPHSARMNRNVQAVLQQWDCGSRNVSTLSLEYTNGEC